MIGEKTKAEKLFYYLRPEELIPEDHILRPSIVTLILPSVAPSWSIFIDSDTGLPLRLS